MLGAVFGDIAGSVYEGHPVKTVDFPLLPDGARFTDDTVMTFAVAKAIIEADAQGEAVLKKAVVCNMQAMGQAYPHRGYGGYFSKWLHAEDPKPYNSLGNGSAMRVSPVGWIARSVEEAEALAKATAEVTHNHPEGIKGAQAIAVCILLARQGADKPTIKRTVESRYGYDLSRSLDAIRPGYAMDATCPGSVPEAIIAFLEGTDYEHVIRLAISLGGDSDTLACMAGGIAEAAFGMPAVLREKAYAMLDGNLRRLASAFSAFRFGKLGA